MKAAENLDNALRYDPFSGDFGSSDDRSFGDSIVTFRRQHWCHMCQCGIAPKTRGRLSVWRFEGEMVSYRWCQDCTVAMARDVLDYSGGFSHTEERYGMRAQSVKA